MYKEVVEALLPPPMRTSGKPSAEFVAAGRTSKTGDGEAYACVDGTSGTYDTCHANVVSILTAVQHPSFGS